MDNNPSQSPIEENEGSTNYSPKARKLIKLALATAAGFILTIGIYKVFLDTSEHDQRPVAEKEYIEPGQRVHSPQTVLTTPYGKITELRDHLGKITLLSFWATWCGPCRVELPTLRDLHQELRDEGLSIVPVNVDAGDIAKVDILNYWDLMNLPFQSFFDPKGDLLQKFKVDVLPANFLLDEEGNVAMVANGANDWSHPMNIKMVRELLKENDQKN